MRKKIRKAEKSYFCQWWCLRKSNINNRHQTSVLQSLLFFRYQQMALPKFWYFRLYFPDGERQEGPECVGQWHYNRCAMLTSSKIFAKRLFDSGLINLAYNRQCIWKTTVAFSLNIKRENTSGIRRVGVSQMPCANDSYYNAGKSQKVENSYIVQWRYVENSNITLYAIFYLVF